MTDPAVLLTAAQAIAAGRAWLALELLTAALERTDLADDPALPRLRAALRRPAGVADPAPFRRKPIRPGGGDGPHAA